MRIFRKKDFFCVFVGLGVCAITGIVYYVGKLLGKADAYGDCANMLQEAIEAAQEDLDE